MTVSTEHKLFLIYLVKVVLVELLARVTSTYKLSSFFFFSFLSFCSLLLRCKSKRVCLLRTVESTTWLAGIVFFIQ